MPFTFSHAAAVVPIRKYGVLSALVLGSFMPDLPYFVPRLTLGSYGHTLPGLFLFCLPAGLVALWIFHAFIKRPMIALFPLSHQQKLIPAAQGFTFFPLKHMGMIALSVLIGAASHITWDLFTHDESWLAERVPLLQTQFTVFAGHTYALAILLQHLSSIFGLVIVTYYYFRWLRNSPSLESVSTPHLPTYARVLLLVTCAVGVILPTIARLMLNPWFWKYGRLGFLANSVIAGLKMMTLEVLLFSFVWHFANRVRQRAPQQPVSD
ncbi:MAG: hypothetical protein JWO13_25 [Acidobacteriales bacterium]|nr:hypothetical protein [Terriglobales bacterium]